MEMEKPYIASLTREPFLFYEMRTTAHLMAGGKTESEILEEIYTQNLFQYPTERSILRIARACIRRLHGLEDESLLRAVYEESTAVSKQICLYAIMKDSRLIQEFMVNVIGGKYRVQDLSFSRMELNVFFLHLQEQNIKVAGWSEATIKKLKQIMMRILVETEYLDDLQTEHLNPVLLGSLLRDVMQERQERALLTAFNCFI